MSLLKPHIDEIDGLRGIAILLVVILHWFFQPLFPYISTPWLKNILNIFAYGVDLFFVISGFLIGGILLRIEKKLSSIATFYLRRILRIWPLYYLLFGTIYLLSRGNLSIPKTPYWAFFLFVFNFYESSGMVIHQALGTLWSLAIEEQFYALAPLLFILLKRKQILFLSIFIIVISPFLRLWISSNSNLDTWRFTFVRLDGISMGILISILFASTNILSNLLPKIHILQVTTFLVFTISGILSIIASPWSNSSIVFSFGFILVTTLIQSHSHQKTCILNSRILRYLGVRCYSIYLFHIFFMLIATTISNNFTIRLILQSILTLGFAHISWRYLEYPMMKLGQKFHY
jgi:peptidoglycan/LPS O-acetylase OafA/YrhL